MCPRSSDPLYVYNNLLIYKVGNYVLLRHIVKSTVVAIWIEKMKTFKKNNIPKLETIPCTPDEKLVISPFKRTK